MILHPSTPRIDATKRISTNSYYHICLPNSMGLTMTHSAFSPATIDGLPMNLPDANLYTGSHPLWHHSKDTPSLPHQQIFLLQLDNSIIIQTISENPSPKIPSHPSWCFISLPPLWPIIFKEFSLLTVSNISPSIFSWIFSNQAFTPLPLLLPITSKLPNAMVKSQSSAVWPATSDKDHFLLLETLSSLDLQKTTNSSTSPIISFQSYLPFLFFSRNSLCYSAPNLSPWAFYLLLSPPLVISSNYSFKYHQCWPLSNLYLQFRLFCWPLDTYVQVPTLWCITDISNLICPKPKPLSP